MRIFIITIVSVVCFITESKSQYQFSFFSEEFNHLDSTQANVLTPDTVWSTGNFKFYKAPIGFNFEIGNETNDSLFIRPESGIVIFHQNCNSSDSMEGSWLYPFHADLMDRGFFTSSGDSSLSPISYLTEGTAGNQVLKLEWKNISFGGGYGYPDFFNFQVWLYEVDNAIEFRFGTGNITDTSDVTWGWGLGGILSGIYYTNDCLNPDTIGQFLHGNENSPKDTILAPGTSYLPVLKNIPDSGIVYRFAPWPVGINNELNKNNDERISIYPIPIQDKVNIYYELTKNSHIEFKLYDYTGKQMKSINRGFKRSGSYTEEIDASTLSPGFYILFSNINGEVQSYKIIKM